MGLSDLTSFELRSRETHTSSDGVSSQRKYHFEPYGEWLRVIRLLEGSVSQDENTGEWERRLPMYDPYFPDFMYCNECRVDPVDWRGVAFSPSMGFQQGRNDEETTAYLKDVLQATSEDLPEGGSIETMAGGAFVTASYVPLITGHADPTDPAAFDWVDPTFKLTFKTVPWPDGLNVCVPDAFWDIPAPPDRRTVPIREDLANPILLPIIEFSVRRLLVGEPRFDVMEGLAGCVNEFAWPGANIVGERAQLINRFPAETLRFDGAQIKNRVSACAYPTEDHRHYEIELHFSWISYMDAPVFDALGSAPQEPQPVTWNHVLMRPQTKFLTFMGNTWGVGWYYISREEKAFFQTLRSEFFKKRVGPLHPLTTFDNLFRLNPQEEED